MNKHLRNEIIDSFIDNICINVLLNLDINPGDDVRLEAIYELSHLDTDERLNVLTDIGEDIVIDDVANGNGEYWRQTYGIYNLENELDGDEFTIAMNYIAKQVNLPTSEWW